MRAPEVEKRIGGDHQSIGPLLCECLEGDVDSGRGPGFLYNELGSDFARRGLQVHQLGVHAGAIRVDKHTNCARTWLELVQQLQSLRVEFRS